MTKNLEGRMILNWDRPEEKDWAREWSANVWHSKEGFKSKRGYRIESYKYPTLQNWQRKKLGRNPAKEALPEPPRGLEEAKEQNERMWMKMHPKFAKRVKPKIKRIKQAKKPKL